MVVGFGCLGVDWDARGLSSTSHADLDALTPDGSAVRGPTERTIASSPLQGIARRMNPVHARPPNASSHAVVGRSTRDSRDNRTKRGRQPPVPDRGPAFPAGLAFPRVDKIAKLEAGFALGVDVIPQRAAALGDRLGQHVADFADQPRPGVVATFVPSGRRRIPARNSDSFA